MEHGSIGNSLIGLVYKEHHRSKFEMLTEKISPMTMGEKTIGLKAKQLSLDKQYYQISRRTYVTRNVHLSHFQWAHKYGNAT